MARETHDREDLLRDARGLVPRIQLQLRWDEQAVTLFAGFRGDSLSLYFDADPVFHFNASGQLRRAFVDDRLIKSEHGRLVDMRRERTPERVELVAEQLSDAAQTALLADVDRRLERLRTRIGEAVVVGQVPEDGDALARLADWLGRHPRTEPALSPRVG
jgi:hypothetical protein